LWRDEPHVALAEHADPVGVEDDGSVELILAFREADQRPLLERGVESAIHRLVPGRVQSQIVDCVQDSVELYPVTGRPRGSTC